MSPSRRLGSLSVCCSAPLPAPAEREGSCSGTYSRSPSHALGREALQACMSGAMALSMWHLVIVMMAGALAGTAQQRVAACVPSLGPPPHPPTAILLSMESPVIDALNAVTATAQDSPADPAGDGSAAPPLLPRGRSYDWRWAGYRGAAPACCAGAIPGLSPRG